MCRIVPLIIVAVLGSVRPAAATPADHLPPHIRQITKFGERAEFSHDGRRILFLSKQFGDVMEYDIETGVISCLSQHFKHHGFNRALYLHNGDILVTGPDKTFDLKDKAARTYARLHATSWVLDKSGVKPLMPLGITMEEGPAVSRTRPLIAWTHDPEPQSPDRPQTRISLGELAFVDGVPAMVNVRQILKAADFPEGQRPVKIETQNFVPPGDKQLTVSAFEIEGTANTDGFLFDIDTGTLSNFTKSPDHFEEVEGVFPDGRSTTVERNEHNGIRAPMADCWRVWFDGSREPQRLTRFLEHAGFKATNPVISDDGRLMAFQLGKANDEAGVGYGLFLMDLTQAPQ
jgi:hypothetical protein